MNASEFDRLANEIREKGLEDVGMQEDLEFLYVLSGFEPTNTVLKFGITNELTTRIKKYNCNVARYNRCLVDPPLVKLRAVWLCKQVQKIETVLVEKLKPHRHRPQDREWVTCSLQVIEETFRSTTSSSGCEDASIVIYQPKELDESRKSKQHNHQVDQVAAPLSKKRKTVSDSKESLSKRDVEKLRQIITNNSPGYVVDLRMLSNILDVREDSIKRVVDKNFQVDVDFICLKGAHRNRMGRPKIRNLITTDTLKRLAMLMNGKSRKVLNDIIFSLIA
jgi:hypothetical protein